MHRISTHPNTMHTATMNYITKQNGIGNSDYVDKSIFETEPNY